MDGSFLRWTIGEDITIEVRTDQVIVDIPYATICRLFPEVAQRNAEWRQCAILGQLDAEYQRQRRELYEAMRARMATEVRALADRWGLPMREWGHVDHEK